jgi:ribosomal protein S18 acetylase RimI-like enzyme
MNSSALPPTEQAQLRLMQPADLADYKALRDAMLLRHEDAFTSDAATEATRPAASYQPRLHASVGGSALFTLVAWQGGRMVAALTCEREPRQKVRHLAHLVGMMVADDQQGQGLGRRLLNQALALLRSEPELEQVTLSVSASNVAALRLYEGAGFTRYGLLPRAIRLPDGRYIDKALMTCPLRKT